MATGTSNVKELGQRLQRIETELEITQRKRKEEAEKAARVLSSIDPKDVDMLSSIVPALKVVVKYSEGDILKNANGEIDFIRQVTKQLREYLEERLSYYEGKL